MTIINLRQIPSQTLFVQQLPPAVRIDPNGEVDGASELTLTAGFAAISRYAALAMQVQAVSAQGSLSIDLNAGWYVRLTLTGDVTAFAAANWPGSNVLGRLTLEIHNPSGYSINAWPSGTLWPGGQPPMLSANQIDVVVLTSSDQGQTILGNLPQSYS